MKSCLLLKREHMRLAMIRVLGSGKLLEMRPYGDTYWKEHVVLDMVRVGMSKDVFPIYRGEQEH